MTAVLRRKRRGGLHLGRYGEILSVLLKYGFGDVLSTLNIERYSSITRRLLPRKNAIRQAKKISRWERIRMALEELGPTFIKFGQFLSNRPDLVPHDLIRELEKLQDAVRPFPVAEARSIVEQDMRRPLSEVFSFFSDSPLASASIAQVHGATLTDGHKVAVKVQRAGIAHMIATDTGILFDLAKLAENRYEMARAIQVSRLVEEFESLLQKELDFQVEATHISRFHRDFRHDDSIMIPTVLRDLTSRRVLVTEYIDGIKASDKEKLIEAGIDVTVVAHNGADFMMKQIFEKGFFHADPHPGNIFVLRDGRICFLDFGAVGILTPSLRHNLGVILYGVINKDPQRIVRTLSQLANERIGDPEQLEYDVAEMIEEYSLAELNEINIGDVLQHFMSIIMYHNLRIMPGFYVLIKAVAAIEGVGRRLHPEFRLIEHIEPHVRKLIRENARLRYLPADTFFLLLDTLSLLKDLPFDAKETLRLIKAGSLHIQFEHRGLEPFLARNDQLVNRLGFAIVLAALIIGSSIVVHSGIPPNLYGIPVIGIAGFLLAALIGFGLLFSMLHKRKV